MQAVLLFLIFSQIAVEPVIDSAVDFPVGKSDGLIAASPLKGEDRVIFAMDRRQWTDPNATVVLEVLTSIDGGKLEVVCSATAKGGAIIDPSQKEITETVINCPLPRPDKDTRELKIDMTVQGGTIKTQVDAATYAEAKP